MEKLLRKIGNSERLKDTLINLGASNKATYAAITIAVAKGIFRPLITMMDKKEDPKTKKYAALREGVTELIAVPTYWACGKLAEKTSNSLQKDPKKLKVTRANLEFLAVGVATLLVVPALCTCLVKPFTNMLFKDDKKRTSSNDKKLDLIEGENNIPNVGENNVRSLTVANRSNPYGNIANVRNNGMRIG